MQKEVELENIRKEMSKNSEINQIKLAQLKKQLEIANINRETTQFSSLTAIKPEIEAVSNNFESLIKSVKALTITVL